MLVADVFLPGQSEKIIMTRMDGDLLEGCMDVLEPVYKKKKKHQTTYFN